MYKILTAIFAIVMGTSLVSQVHAGTYQQNWQAGFDDGISDCQSGTANAFNGHSNSAHHTDAYIAGYNAGFNCHAGTVTVTNHQQQAQYQNQNPNYSCFTLIGNCGTQNSAQSEDQGQGQGQ